MCYLLYKIDGTFFIKLDLPGRFLFLFEGPSLQRKADKLTEMKVYIQLYLMFVSVWTDRGHLE